MIAAVALTAAVELAFCAIVPNNIARLAFLGLLLMGLAGVLFP